MTEERLKEIEARAAAATPGPWGMDPPEGWMKRLEIDSPGVFVDYDDVDHKQQEANAVFIIHARYDIPALCAALRSAWDECNYWQNEANAWSEGEVKDYEPEQEATE
jgi:hypothetical protein